MQIYKRPWQENLAAIVISWICLLDHVTLSLAAPVSGENKPANGCDGLTSCDGSEDVKANWQRDHELDPLSFSHPNDASLPSNLHGDIVLTPEMEAYFKDRLKTRHKRKLMTNFDEMVGKWPLPIEYYIRDDFTESQVSAIESALHHYVAQTCISFQRLTAIPSFWRQLTGDPYLTFTKSSTASRCASYVGRVQRKQEIWLGNDCFDDWAVIVHELGHSIGLWHEHQRSDRDGHIEIFPDRMVDGTDPLQYLKGETNNLEPYDYGSVMHYNSWAFSSTVENITLQPTDLRYLQTTGQRNGLSFLDTKLINRAYCSDACSFAITCQNGGYQSPKACDTCICPDGYEGSRCQDLAKAKNAQCGGKLELAPNTQIEVTSPGFNRFQSYYQDNTECTWLLEAPVGHQITLQFDSSRFGMFCRAVVCRHYLEVRTASDDLAATGPRYCCRTFPTDLPVLKSDGRRMMLLMRSNYTTTGFSRWRIGFRVFIKAERDTAVTIPDDVRTEAAPTTIPTQGLSDDPTTAGTSPSSGRLDVALLMDSSGSVGYGNWELTKEFCKNIISQFDIGKDAVQFSFVSVGSRGYVDFGLSQYSSVASMSRAIDALRWRIESTHMASALDVTRQSVFSSEAGDRADVPNLVLLLTDGPATAGAGQVPGQVRLIKTRATLVILGVGPGVNDRYKSEFRGYVSKPVRSNFLYAERYTELDTLLSPVTQMIRDLSGGTEPEGCSLTCGANEVLDTESCECTTFSWSCGFESNNVCDMTQDTEDNFDWRVFSGSTPSGSTGPSSARSGNYYIYIEATGKARGQFARIFLPAVTTEGLYCLSFHYSMYGFHVNRLQVDTRHADGSGSSVWSRTGQQVNSSVNSWRRGEVIVTLRAGSKIAISAYRGGGYSGDIALDDVTLTLGSCATAA